MAGIPNVYSSNISTGKILDAVHEKVIATYNYEKLASIQKPKAARMEQILRALKMIDRNPDDILDVELQNAAREIVLSSTTLMNAARGGRQITKTRTNGSEVSYTLNDFFSKSLFHRSHGVLSGYGADDIFEEELAAVLATIEAKGTGKIADINMKMTGSVLANVNLEDATLNPVVVKILKELDKQFSKKQAKANKDYSKLTYRSQKVDVTGIQGTFTAELNDIWKEMFELFSGASFTVKNYSSIGKDGNLSTQLNIHLGNTNAFKSFYAVLSSCGYDQSSIEKLFYRSFAKKYITGAAATSDKVLSHIYHIQFIYELTGVGLYDANGAIDGADYLIYNDPASNNIYVRSTAELIAAELKKMDVNRFMKSISIPKSSF